MLCRGFKPLSVRKMEVTEYSQAEKEQSSKAQGGIGKATGILISGGMTSFYGPQYEYNISKASRTTDASYDIVINARKSEMWNYKLILGFIPTCHY